LGLDWLWAFFNKRTWLEIDIRHIGSTAPRVIDNLNTRYLILMKPSILSIYDIRASPNFFFINYTNLLVRTPVEKICSKFRIETLKLFQIFVKFPTNIILILSAVYLQSIQNIMCANFGFIKQRIEFPTVFQYKPSFIPQQFEFL
jgi:hypothetical protein